MSLPRSPSAVFVGCTSTSQGSHHYRLSLCISSISFVVLPTQTPLAYPALPHCIHTLTCPGVVCVSGPPFLAHHTFSYKPLAALSIYPSIAQAPPFSYSLALSHTLSYSQMASQVDLSTQPYAVHYTSNDWIEMRDGVRLAVSIWRPDTTSVRAPVLLEYLPYRKADDTSVRDHLRHPYFASCGLAVARVDIRGSGNSEGCALERSLDRILARYREGARFHWVNAWIGLGMGWGLLD